MLVLVKGPKNCMWLQGRRLQTPILGSPGQDVNIKTEESLKISYKRVKDSENK